MVAASDSIAMSASTLSMSACSLSSFPNALRCAGVVRRLCHGLSHERGRADDAVKPRVIDHLDDGAHSSPLLPDHLGPRVHQLDLRGSVGPVAELVFESLDVEAVEGAVRQDARQEEARQPAGRLGKYEKRIAHRR